jgi:hypothetical protein
MDIQYENVKFNKYKNYTEMRGNRTTGATIFVCPRGTVESSV